VIAEKKLSIVREVFEIRFNERDLLDFIRARGGDTKADIRLVVKQNKHIDKIVLRSPSEIRHFAIEIITERGVG
jgi:hypothetical protein